MSALLPRPVGLTGAVRTLVVFFTLDPSTGFGEDPMALIERVERRIFPSPPCTAAGPEGGPSGLRSSRLKTLPDTRDNCRNELREPVGPGGHKIEGRYA